MSAWGDGVLHSMHQKIRHPHIFCQPLFFVKNHKSLPIFATFQERVLSMWICSKLTIRTPERTRDPILYFFLAFLSVKYNEKKTALTVYWLVSRKRSNIGKNVFDHFMVKWSNTLNKNLKKIFANPGKQLFWSNWKKWKFGFWGFKSVCMFSSTSFMSLSLKESWCHHREIVFLRMFLFLETIALCKEWEKYKYTCSSALLGFNKENIKKVKTNEYTNQIV